MSIFFFWLQQCKGELVKIWLNYSLTGQSRFITSLCTALYSSALNITLSAAAGWMPDQYLLPAPGCSKAAAALSQIWIKRTLLSKGQTDRWTGIRTLHRPCSAYYPSSINNHTVIFITSKDTIRVMF